MSLARKFITVTPFSKALALILFILLPFGTFFLGLKYEKKINLMKEKRKVNVPNITDAQILYNQSLNPDQREIKLRDIFLSTDFANFPEFAQSIENEQVVKVFRMTGIDEWLVETVQKEDSEVINPTNYGMRDYYYVSPERWGKLTKKRTICYVKDYLVQSHNLNIISTTTLDSDRLILQLECDQYGAYDAVALYNFETLEQINFSGKYVDENKYSKGYLLNLFVTRKEPVVVVDDINVNGNDYQAAKSANDSQGIRIYSLRNGALLYSLNNFN